MNLFYTTAKTVCQSSHCSPWTLRPGHNLHFNFLHLQHSTVSGEEEFCFLFPSRGRNVTEGGDQSESSMGILSSNTSSGRGKFSFSTSSGTSSISSVVVGDGGGEG